MLFGALLDLIPSGTLDAICHVEISVPLTLITCGERQDAAADGREPKPLVYVRPEDNMAVVVERLFDNRCSMAPILSGDPNGAPLDVSHIAWPVCEPVCQAPNYDVNPDTTAKILQQSCITRGLAR